MNGTTIDGKPSEPLNVRLRCEKDKQSHKYYIVVTWDLPAEPNGNLSGFWVRNFFKTMFNFESNLTCVKVAEKFFILKIPNNKFQFCIEFCI